MSETLNKVILIGYLGDDVKMHHFENDGCIGNISLATNESYTSKQTGEKITHTEWHHIVARNKLAKVCEKYLVKGDKIYVEGIIKTRTWQDDSGNNRHKKEIHITTLKFMNSKTE